MTPHEREQARRKEYADWLAALKVGDRVCFSDYGGWDGGQKYRILAIERMTATQAVCSNNLRFRLKDGNVIGVSYRRVEPITNDVLKANDEAQLRQWFKTLASQRTIPSTPVLRAMKEAAEAAAKAEAEKGGAA